MPQGQPEKGHSFVLRMRYEGRTAEKIRRSATPQTLKNIFTKSVAKDLKLLKISLPKQSNVRISQAVQEALELTYDVKKTAQVLERNLKTHIESATPDQLKACSLISLELFQFQFNSVAGPLQPSDIPFLWAFANPTLVHGGGPGYFTATETSYAMMQASNQLSFRESWPSDAPPSSSFDITTPSTSSTSATFPAGSTFPHPSLPPRPSATHDSSFSLSHIVESTPKAPQTVHRSNVTMSTNGSSSIQLDGRERSKKKSGSNAIPLGRRNEGQLFTFARQTEAYEYSPGYVTESATPLQNPIQESYLLGSSSFSSPTPSDDSRTELFRLRSQVEAQNEALRGYKRTVEAMMDGETEMQREIKRLRMADEQALEVVMKMQEDAIQDEGQDNVKSECDLLTALHVIGRHINILRNSRDQERRGRQMIEEQLLEERHSRAKDMVNIERECRDPFVVPALLQAFLKMSEMTDTILE